MSFRRSSAAGWRSLIACLALAFAAISAQAQTLPTAPQVASQINLGWNLGNTLEAICSETAWGNPVANQTLINSVKAAGFNAIRIPVSWNCHITDGTTNIPADWMTRVKQVVDMAISANMYVIINIHWDGGWLQDHVTDAEAPAINARQNALWTQIATTFRTYDQRLLFAGTNEVHADYGTPTAEHNRVQQSYNQTFVNAVRATGGNNASRTLVVQTYNTNIQHGLNFFNLPTDTIANRLMVEVHNYDPYDFTINPNGACNVWGAPYPDSGSNCNWAYESYFDALFAQVRQRWVDQGIPVILGEYGVETRSGKNLEARAYWNEYINRAAAQNGIKTFYWDNGAPQTGNTFILFNRTTGAVVDQAVLNAILRGSGVGNPNVNYTLTTAANPGNGGTVTRSPTGTSFPGGTDVTLTATPAAGNDFVGWTGDASGTTNPRVVRILGNTTVTANFVPTGTGGSGTITREYWLNVQGNTVASLTGNAAYPNSPTGTESLTSFEGPTNVADQYGSRVRGYIHPPITGSYVFWIASDDASDLLLSTSDNPANATRIAFVAEWTDPRQWTKYPAQRSASINLVGGQKYYIEAIQKEATGGDNLAVSWQGPGFGQTVIPGNFLSPFIPGPVGNFTLSVTKTGTGTGTVAGGAINCGTVCSASVTSGSSVTLTATPASGSTFSGWTGACTNATGTCTVSMTQARSVTATFTSQSTTFALTVARAGTGTGTVTSSPAGISCGTTCTANYSNNTSVTLTAAAASGSTFAGWSGACTNVSGTCTVSMTAARSVTATFNSSSTFALAITKMGTGTGTVTSSPTGINCGATCTANFANATNVTLTAAASTGSTFGGWSGACTGTTLTCTVAMTQARNVTATFNTTSSNFPLTVTLAGTGSGTVTSSPAGINCGTTCSASYASTVSVTLTATAASGSTFAGFGGACTGTTCTVAMSQARAVTATFNTTGTGGTCANPVTFSGNTGNFGTTGAACYRTNATVNGWGCYNFDGRSVSVGGVARTCGQMPLTRSADGYYYFSVTAGQFAWAGLYTW
jgi:endoglucanase